MSDTMNLYDAVHEMRKSIVPFSIEYVTYSRDRNEGGKRVKLENVLCAGQINNQQHDMLQGFKRVDDPENHVIRCYIHNILYYNGIKLEEQQ
jgi:hypothetical protein